VIVPIWRGQNKGEVRREAEKLYVELQTAGFRMEVDLDEEHSPGWKFNEHELRGCRCASSWDRRTSRTSRRCSCAGT
jgi:prolyl-tRNA synthetase